MFGMVIIRTLTLLRLVKTLVMTIMRPKMLVLTIMMTLTVTLTSPRLHKEVGRDNHKNVNAIEIQKSDRHCYSVGVDIVNTTQKCFVW